MIIREVDGHVSYYLFIFMDENIMMAMGWCGVIGLIGWQPIVVAGS